MWICLNNGFVSIVEYRSNPYYVIVRARDEDSIKNIFGSMVYTEETPSRDYRYRAILSKEYVSKIIAEKVLDINYPNFKNSVEDNDLHAAYSSMWFTMYKYQTEKLYGKRPANYLPPPMSARLQDVPWTNVEKDKKDESLS